MSAAVAHVDQPASHVEERNRNNIVDAHRQQTPKVLCGEGGCKSQVVGNLVGTWEAVASGQCGVDVV